MRKPDRVTDRGELRSIAREILNAPISKSTLAEYGRIEKRLNGQHWCAYAVENRLKCVTTIRAAWQRATANQVLIELGRSEDPTLSSVERADARLTAVKFVERLIEHVVYEKPTFPRNSKCKGQTSLPMDWRERVLFMMPGKYKIQYMVMAITGARPDEIRKGFRVRAMEDGTVEVTLLGAKVSELTGGGQDWRRLVVDPRFVLPISGLFLHEDISVLGGEVNFPPTKGIGLQKAISRAAKGLGYDGISAYSLRHAFATDLKQTKTDGDAISLAMGHVSRRSRQRYGRWRGGKSGNSPLKYVEAAKALTGIEKIPPWLAVGKVPVFEI